MSSMPRLPGLPKIKSVNRCECGCPGLTGNRFVPGHDAKLLGMVKRVEAGVWAEAKDPMSQIAGLVIWAAENLPGDPVRYGYAVAKAMKIAWAPAKEEKAG